MSEILFESLLSKTISKMKPYSKKYVDREVTELYDLCSRIISDKYPEHRGKTLTIVSKDKVFKDINVNEDGTYDKETLFPLFKYDIRPKNGYSERYLDGIVWDLINEVRDYGDKRWIAKYNIGSNESGPTGMLYIELM